MIRIYHSKNFFCHFRALAYRTLDKLAAVFFYVTRCRPNET